MEKKLNFTHLAWLLASVFVFSAAVDSYSQTSARGGGKKNKSDKLVICHIPPGNPENAHTIEIDASAWDAHAAHGDSIGKCDNERNWNRKEKITICHFPPGNPDNVQRITIAVDAWPAHEAHGDAIGDDCEKDEEEEVSATLETTDSEICLGESTALTVQFTGDGPWTLFYNINGESNEVSGIETATYELPVSQSGLYVLTGVSDVDGDQGDAIGEVMILAPPTASFVEGGYVCEGEALDLQVNLGGEGPWTFTYYHANEENTVTSDESTAIIPTTIAGEYYIISVTNGKCETVITDQEIVVVEAIETGTVEISGGGDIYEGETAIIKFNMSGVGPWTITYTDGTEEYTFTTEETYYEVEVSNPGRYSIVSVEGGACVLASGEGFVEVYELPTAELIIETPEICEDDDRNMTIVFTGSGPWDLTYSINGDEIIIEDIQDAEFTTELSGEGTYSVVNVTDANGRDGRATGEFDVNISELPYATIEGGGSICPGDEAEITINLTGDGPWTFTYFNGTEEVTVDSDQPVYSFRTSEPGEYRIRTITNTTCSVVVEDVVTVVEVNEVATAEISGGGEIFPGQTATVNFDLTGQAPWTVEFSNGTNSQTFTTSNPHYEVQVAEPGDYSITGFSANGCSFETTGEVTIYELPTAELIIDNPDFCSDDDKNMTISFTGSGPWDLTYSVNNNPLTIQGIQTAQFVTEISGEGEYKVLGVTDANGKEGRVNGEFDVTISEIPFATIEGGGQICPGDEAEITVNLGGDGPWTFSYFNGNEEVTVDSDNPTYSFRTSDPGEYRIRTITSGNCFVVVEDAVAIVEVNEVSTVDLSGGGNIFNGETATLLFDMTGQGPWTVEVSNDATTRSFTTTVPHYELEVAEQGTYTVTAFSASGCSFESSGEVVVYELPTASLTSSSQKVCEGESAMLAFNLTGNGPWDVTYSVDGSNYTVNGITDPNYSVEVTEGENFGLVSVVDVNQESGRATGNMSVNFEELPDVSLFGGGIICEGEQSIIRMDLSGEGPWTVTYTDGVNTNSITTSNPSYRLNTGTEGTYQVLSVTNGRCENSNITAQPVSLDVIEQPTARISGSTDICPNESTLLTVDLTGEGPWTFSYTDGKNPYTVTTDESQVQLPASTEGTYTITSVSTQGCSNTGTGSAVVGVIKSIAAQGSLVTEETHCQGTEIFMQLEIPTGVDYDVTWSSTGDGEFSSTNGTGAIYIPASTDEGLQFVASVTNLCETVNFSANTLIEKINSNFEIQPNSDEIFSDVEYTFEASSNEGDDYEWEYSDGTKDSGTTSSHTFEESGTHSVSLTVGKGDCSNTTTNTFIIVPNTNLYVPSVFNPESTKSENRVLKVYGEDVSLSGFSFEIRNRWGLILYKTSSFEQANTVGWDGTSAKGEPQENGVYTYVLKGQFNNGDSFERTGTITLVK